MLFNEVESTCNLMIFGWGLYLFQQTKQNGTCLSLHLSGLLLIANQRNTSEHF